MLFIALMFITTTCVAGAAAFFSVYGLAHTFAASFWSVVFMGGSLEAGKLMLASYLYRFKDTVTFKAKALGYIFVLVLMLITSLGIYGYLADAYQSGSTDMKQVNASLDLKKQEEAKLEKRKGEIDAQIALVPVKDVRGKQRLMKQFGPEVDTINKRLIAVTAEIQQEAQKQITTDSHVGPIVFVAKIVGIEADNAISLLILAIVFAFDPLAIYLTIATNTALAQYLAKKKKPAEPEVEIIHHEEDEPPTLVMQDDVFIEVPEVDPVPMKMDIITGEAAPQQPNWNEVTTEEGTSYFPEINMDLPSMPLVEDVMLDRAESSAGDDPLATFDSSMTREEVKEQFDALVEQSRAKPDMKVLGEQFAKEESEDVTFEDGTEAPPVQQLVKIYEEAAAKDIADQTPVDRETMAKIERFFARQDLIKNVRGGTVE